MDVLPGHRLVRLGQLLAAEPPFADSTAHPRLPENPAIRPALSDVKIELVEIEIRVICRPTGHGHNPLN